MIILAIDMSGDRCSIGIGQEKSILAESSTFARMRHLPRIMPQIDFTLKQAQKTIKDIDLFCAVSGPGSWTGIRIAITMLKTFGHVLSKPCVTVNSLDALSCNMKFVTPLVYPIIDASRKQVYYAAYDCQDKIPKNITPPTLLNIDAFLEKIETHSIILGDGIYAYSEKINNNNANLLISSDSFNYINIYHVIELGHQKFLKNGPDSLHDISPDYLQKTDAERNFGKNNKQKS